MSKINPQYKCRRCNLVYGDAILDTGNISPIDILDDSARAFAWAKLRLPLTIIHCCSEDGCGVGDLIGYSVMAPSKKAERPALAAVSNVKDL
jgi:hypothetical protein